ncbi:MAG: hypothetical protein NCW75_05585 [Phycisphaera sp.]|nr:MAG: hypothetical protein NCW75_05585 [Phycisphaera sp.]
MAITGPITAEEYRAAIRAVLIGGQSYTLTDGTSVTQADLADLEARLEAAIRREATASSGMMRRVSLGRPS